MQAYLHIHILAEISDRNAQRSRYEQIPSAASGGRL
jgi:hypothetical protein